MQKRIHLVHHRPGRLRLSVHGLERNPALKRRILALDGKLPGVEKISASIVTGSVPVGYDGRDLHVLIRLKRMIDDAEAWLPGTATELQMEPPALRAGDGR